MTQANPADEILWNDPDVAVSVRQEAARHHAVNVAIVIYLIIVLEGLLRKYILPDLQRPLVFLRDPIILYLYIHALRHRFIKRSVFLVMGGGILLLASLLVIPESFGTDESTLFVVYGLRQYFFPLLLPFVIASTFRHDDMQRFFRINLYLLIAMAPLMVLQVLSPPSSWINTGASLDEENTFENLSFGDFVRAPGFFTAAQPVGLWLPFLAALILAVWMMPKKDRPCSSLILFGAAFAMMVAIATSGSRAAVTGLAFVALGAIANSFFMPGSRAAARALGATLFLAVAGTVTFVGLFSDQLEALQDRWSGANATDNEGYLAIIFRAFNHLWEFVDVLPDTPLTGYGLGTATNAATMLIVDPSASLSSIWDAAENDWSRHIIELGPLVGILYIVFRIALTVDLGFIGVRTATKGRDPRAWLIFSAVGYTVLNGTMSGQTTMNGLSWFFIGIILAAPNYLRAFR